MAHLIDKDALVAEIERRKKKNLLNEGAFEEDIDILSFLDTLEVKEVDLDKELKDFINCDNGRTMFEIAKHFFELGMRFSAIGSDYIEGVRGYYETTTK